MTRYIVTAIEVGGAADGHASVLGVFDTRMTAETFMREDMKDTAAADCAVVDYDRHEVWKDASKTDGCLWDIHEVDVDEPAARVAVDNASSLAVDYNLAACPFCGRVDTVVFSNALEDEYCSGGEGCPAFSGGNARDECGMHYAICDATRGGCGASSGWGETLDEVADKWNARAVTPAAARESGHVYD